MSAEYPHHLATYFLTADQREATAGDRAAELVRHGGDYAGNVTPVGGPGGGVGRMGVHDAADLRHVSVYVCMGRGVGAVLVIAAVVQRVQFDLAHVIGSKVLEHDSAGFDDHGVRAGLAAADIAARPGNQAVCRQQHMQPGDFGGKFGVHAETSSRATLRMRRSRFMTPAGSSMVLRPNRSCRYLYSWNRLSYTATFSGFGRYTVSLRPPMAAAAAAMSAYSPA